MIYVMSDIHGEYEKYEAMLKQIHFSDQDTLYVLGDVIDRGRDGLKTMLDMMQRPNVIALIGNHEWMAARCLPWLQREITEEFLRQLQEEKIQALSLWLNNGAMTTIAEFQRLSDSQRTAVLDYMMDLIPYAIVLVDDRRYLLVHAGLCGKRGRDAAQIPNFLPLICGKSNPSQMISDSSSSLRPACISSAT